MQPLNTTNLTSNQLAFDAGVQAHGWETNPYVPGTKDYAEWDKGFKAYWNREPNRC